MSSTVGYQPGKTAQELATPMERTIDRRTEPAVAGPLAALRLCGYRVIPDLIRDLLQPIAAFPNALPTEGGPGASPG